MTEDSAKVESGTYRCPNCEETDGDLDGINCAECGTKVEPLPPERLPGDRASIDERIRRFRVSQKNRPARAAQSLEEAVRVLTGVDDAE